MQGERTTRRDVDNVTRAAAPEPDTPCGRGRRSRKTRHRLIAAIGEIGRARIADRPAAFARREVEERAALHALHRHRFACLAADAGRRRKHQAQKLALRRGPRLPGAWRAGTRRRRGPPRRQAETMDLADDGVTGDADLSGDLAAGQTGGDAVAELFDPLGGPRGVSRGVSWGVSRQISRRMRGAPVELRVAVVVVSSMERPHEMQRPVLGRRQGKGRAQRAFAGAAWSQQRAFGARACNTSCGSTGAAITEPHPR